MQQNLPKEQREHCKANTSHRNIPVSCNIIYLPLSLSNHYLAHALDPVFLYFENVDARGKTVH